MNDECEHLAILYIASHYKIVASAFFLCISCMLIDQMIFDIISVI